MPTHLFTVEQAAEHLNLHVKTVRRYVHDGRLKAKRIGKEYRITRADLDDFAGADRPSAPEPVVRTRHVLVSSIVDVDAISREESDRIGTTLMAMLNARKGEDDFPRIDVIYYLEQGKLRITITAGVELTSQMLRIINALLEDGRSEVRR